MRKKLISLAVLAILIFGGMLMITSCETKSETVTLNFLSNPLASTKGELVPYTVTWDDSIIDTPPDKFSPALSQLSLVLSAATHQSDTILDDLERLSFEHKAKFNYGDNKDSNAVGIAIASRKVADTTLIAIVLRGTLDKEWYSNFDIGRDTATTLTHEGFLNATTHTMKKLDMYLTNYGIDKDNVKFLVTGHSRGGAVANLLAKELIDIYSKENVYAYTFATPNTTLSPMYNNIEYAGIFNFVNPQDFIGYIPLESWGFHKFGTTITFDTADTADNYSEKYEKVKSLFYTYSHHKLNAYEDTKKLEEFLSTAQTLAPTIDDYYNKKYKVADKELSLYEYMMTIGYILNDENTIDNALIMLGSQSSELEVLTDFILNGLDFDPVTFELNFDDSYIAHAHTYETYLAWLLVYIEYL